ncbi:tetratricopeptide repeat protein [Paenibacillus athensensis]|uniref:Uncharacterized protein n=1 Tax=Paenibacillus athensensis TaxID=1967502 RepID=A0A4Y8PYA2_9BACL|nr:tetratricopeptide repeat protein [Paenibacillus athensensis]MCD1258024.1 tetratricopeptide repeat protein [Paenibacillus athensensis]
MAYHFLRELCRMCEQATFPVPAFVYVLTDLPEANLRFWRDHPRLQPYIEQGCLDMACFDAEQDTELQLRLSGKVIRPGQLQQPLVLIANYFFDSIPQDLFRFYENKAFVYTVDLPAPVMNEPFDAAGWLKQAEMRGRYDEMPPKVYEEPEFNAILEQYRKRLSDTHVYFPVVGLRCLERLRRLSTEGFVLLSADKGADAWGELEGNPLPGLVRHGSVSLTVNYHAIKSYYEQQAAQAYFTEHHHQFINIACVVMLADGADYGEVKLAYERFVGQYGPDDFFTLKKHFDAHLHEMELRHLLALMRFSGFDARLFKQAVPFFLNLVQEAGPRERMDLQRLMCQVWEGYYPIGEEQDLAFDLALLFYEMDEYEEALRFFQSSLDGYGPAGPTYYNMGVCSSGLGRLEEAQAWLLMCLEVDPGHQEAAAMLKELEA